MGILDEIQSLEDEKQAQHLMRFFKTGKGQYGEGDKFLGIKVPVTRALAKKYYKELSLKDIQKLIDNEYHEVRLCGLLMLVLQYEKTDNKENIVSLYLKNVKNINNWDLVDLSAPKIIGKHVFETKSKEIIFDLANSNHLWSERIAVVSQWYIIRQKDFSMILELSEKFLTHKHDLMHKATGWMLREMGKVDEKPLYDFLDKFYTKMPRTMLRYAIEKLPADKKAHYMKK